MKILRAFFKFFIVAGVMFLVTFTLSIMFDVIEFYEHTQKGNDGLPVSQSCWYDKGDWLRNPYSSFRIAMTDKRVYVAHNVVGDLWICESHMVNGVEFWTILVKVPKSDLTADTNSTHNSH